MANNPLKQPFQFKKIDLTNTSQKQDIRAKNTLSTMGRIGTYLLREKGKLSLVFLMVIISSALGLLGPYLVGMAIDDFIVTKATSGMVTLLIVLFMIYLTHSSAIFLQKFWMIGIAQNTVYTLREQLFHQFHALSISFFDKRQQGELMSRVTNDIDNINNTLNESVIQIFASIITLIGTVTVMLILSPILTAITMTIIPIMFLSMKWITKRTGPLYKIQQHDLGVLNGYVEETVSGQHVVKVFSQEKRVTNEFTERNRQLKLSSFWAQTFAGFIPKVMNMLNFLSFALIALFGGILYIKGNITIGIIVIFTEYARQFTRPLNELSNQFNILLSAVAGAERVFSILDEEQEEIDEQEAISLQTTKGHIIFDNVSFSYDQEPVLKNIDFEAKSGQNIALVGHTGAGKTTIVNLLTRFYQYQQGKILLDGVPLHQFTRDSLRTKMAFVLQDTFLFQGTIRENIRYGRLNATDEEVVEAAKKANAHSFIDRLECGYDTEIQSEGTRLSQGQKQLITIARAMIANPQILILDEATSNIDTITELKIQEALKRLMKGRTSFIIAHRLNTVRQADEIILLEAGEIVEKGTHEELLKQRGKYFQLYQAIDDEVG